MICCLEQLEISILLDYSFLGELYGYSFWMRCKSRSLHGPETLNKKSICQCTLAELDRTSVILVVKDSPRYDTSLQPRAQEIGVMDQLFYQWPPAPADSHRISNHLQALPQNIITAFFTSIEIVIILHSCCSPLTVSHRNCG